MLNIIIIPPIVGVPCFFKCDLGPSSLSICPTFNFFNIGIIINPQTTEITNVASNTFISKSNFIKPFQNPSFVTIHFYIYRVVLNVAILIFCSKRPNGRPQICFLQKILIYQHLERLIFMQN